MSAAGIGRLVLTLTVIFTLSRLYTVRALARQWLKIITSFFNPARKAIPFGSVPARSLAPAGNPPAAPKSIDLPAALW